jgi:hypothetical protein
MFKNEKTVFVVIIAVLAIIVVCLGILVFVKNMDSDNSSSRKDANKSNEIKSNVINTIKTDSNNSEKKTSITGKKSSKESLLSVGEWGIASKYAYTEDMEYKNIPIRIDKIVRGNEANVLLKEFCDNSNGRYEYTGPKAGMELLMVYYTTELSSVMTDYGVSQVVDSNIIGTGSDSKIKYNGINYRIWTMNITDDYTENQFGKGVFTASLPIGCTDYIIVMGGGDTDEASIEHAYFKGQ